MLLLKGFEAALVLGPITLVPAVPALGFFNIDNNSAEDNLTLELEAAGFIPVAAEAKLPIIK